MIANSFSNKAEFGKKNHERMYMHPSIPINFPVGPAIALNPTPRGIYVKLFPTPYTTLPSYLFHA